MEIQEILAEGNFAVWEKLATDIVNRHDFKISQEPETCTVMMKVRDSVGDAPFYLGEVLMTEASVLINGAIGFGFTLEDEPARALCYAIIDGALAAEIPEKEEILSILDKEKQLILERRKNERDLIAGTKVQFAIMEG